MNLGRRLFRFLLQTLGLLFLAGMVTAGAAALVLPRFLQVNDSLAKADYIVPLAGEWHRYIRAAEAYNEGLAPRILLSNSYIRPPSRYQKLRAEVGLPLPDSRTLRRQILTHLGVPGTAIDAFGDGHISTLEEAEALRAYLKGGAARIILVTSPYHTRRAKIIFEDVMPEVTFMVTSPPEGALKRHWWRDQKSAQRVLSETSRLIYYLLGGSFRAKQVSR